MIKIRLTSVMVPDQEKARLFYMEKLGFALKRDLPMGEARWLTLVSPSEPDGAELLLEPLGFAPAATFQKALYEAGIPLTAFAVDDLDAAYEDMKAKGVVFKGPPMQMGPTKVATLDDTCGNFIQLFEA